MIFPPFFERYITLAQKFLLDSVRKLQYNSTIHEIFAYKVRKGVLAMKKFLYGSIVRRRKEPPACPSDAAYDNAMKVYKMFAYVSGAVVTLVYIISQVF